MESEIELNDIIQEMQVIGTRPELYPVLLQSHGIQLLLSLLSHENSGELKGKRKYNKMSKDAF